MRVRSLALLVPIAMLGGLLGGAQASASPGSASSPLLTSGRNGSLMAVSTSSPTDAWAVGIRGSDYPNGFKSLTEHWDGHHWVRIHTPSPGDETVLGAVADVSPTDAWAGGFFYDTAFHTIMLHWDGTTWTRVTAPDVGQVRSFAVVSADDIWATGTNEYGVGGFVEHWDGSAWTLVTTPVAGFGDTFTGISATSPTDAWVVGYAYRSASRERQMTLTEHWDGTSWSIVKSADPDRKFQTLYAVSASTPTDVWSVGQYGCDGCGALSNGPAKQAQVTLAEHWDGSTWTTVDSPGNQEAALQGVSAISADDAWAVGNNHFESLIEHWDGSAWTITDSPQPPEGNSSNLAAVSAEGPTDVWAVGESTSSGDTFRTWVEHWDGTAWTEF